MSAILTNSNAFVTRVTMVTDMFVCQKRTAKIRHLFAIRMPLVPLLQMDCTVYAKRVRNHQHIFYYNNNIEIEKILSFVIFCFHHGNTVFISKMCIILINSYILLHLGSHLTSSLLDLCCFAIKSKDFVYCYD